MTLAALIQQVAATDPAVQAAIDTNNDLVVAEALNRVRSDVQVSRGVVPIDALVPEVSAAALAGLDAQNMATFNLAALLRVVNFDDPAVQRAATALGIPTTRVGSLAERGGVVALGGVVHHTEVSAALRAPTIFTAGA